MVESGSLYYTVLPKKERRHREVSIAEQQNQTKLTNHFHTSVDLFKRPLFAPYALNQMENMCDMCNCHWAGGLKKKRKGRGKKDKKDLHMCKN